VDTEGGAVEHQPTERRRGTKATNKAIAEQTRLALGSVWASTQDVDMARGDEIGFTVEQEHYHAFAKRFAGTGINTVSDYIKKASIIGTWGVLQEWSKLMDVWRQSDYDQNAILAQSTQLPAIEERGYESDDAMYIDESSVDESDEEEDDAQSEYGGVVGMSNQDHDRMEIGDGGARRPRNIQRATRSGLQDFRDIYFSASKTEARGIGMDMRHRWLLAKVFRRSERLENRLRAQQLRPGRPGYRIKSVAREELFKLLYKRHRTHHGATKQSAPRLWEQFVQSLEHGKRWNQLQESLGGGIFAVLPQRGIPNSWIERLPKEKYSTWIEMVKTCNPEGVKLGDAAKPYFISCMMGNPAPLWKLGLEMVVDWEDCKRGDLTRYFEPVPSGSQEL
jgi:hypothetical protein